MIVAQDKTGSCGLSADQPRPKKKRRLKNSSTGSQKGRKIFLIGMVLLGFSLSVMVTYFQARVFKLGYQIASMQQELALLRVENHDLDEKVQQLSSLERVETLAVNKLGMVKPDGSNVIMLAVTGEEQAQSDAVVSDEAAGSPHIGDNDNGSLLFRAFNELVNRLASKNLPGRDIGTGSEGGTYADNKSFNKEKNNRTLSDYRGNLSYIDNPAGLVADC